MNWLTEMMGMQRKPQDLSNPLQAQFAVQDAQQRRYDAQNMMNTGYQGGGLSGFLPGLVGLFKGKSMKRNADQDLFSALSKQMEFDAQKQAADEQKRLAEEDRRFKKELEKIAAIEAEKAKNRPQDLYQSWLAQQTPEKIDKAFAIKAGFEARPGVAPVVNVNTGGPAPTPFETALDKKDAEYFGTLRDAATMASQTLDQAKVIEGIMGEVETGKVPQALAMAGQYFGSEAGANLETFQAVSNRMVLDLASKVKGSLSDSDRRMLEQSVPSFGMNQKANKVVLGLIKKGAENAQSTYKAADQYATEKRSMRGFVPPMALNISLPQAPGYQVGQIIDLNGRKYRVTGGDPADPDLEEVK